MAGSKIGATRSSEEEEQGSLVNEQQQVLPDEVLLKVLAEHLPLLPLCRLRSVCKAWRTPQLSRAVFHSSPLYLRCDYGKDLVLYDRLAGKTHKLGEHTFDESIWKAPLDGACINGLVGFVLQSGSGEEIVVSDLFNLHSWTPLPLRPPTPDGYNRSFFVAMGKNPGCSDVSSPCRLGAATSNLLDNYFCVAAMARQSGSGDLFHTHLMLQVCASGGQWSSSGAIALPASGYTIVGNHQSSVLHGSVFYFLVQRVESMERGSFSHALCYVDVFDREAASCKVVSSSCYGDTQDLDILDMEASFMGLGVCSGKVLLVYTFEDPEPCKWCVKVQVLDGDELKLVSCLVPEIYPEWICFGAEEVLYVTFMDDDDERELDELCDFAYNVASNKWDKVTKAAKDPGFLRSLCHL